ncbi:MAG: tetratricopeptide repeat protein [Burkholderiaceae bacterium]
MNRLTQFCQIVLLATLISACAPQGAAIKPVGDGLQEWERSTRVATRLIAQGEYDLALKKAQEALTQVKALPLAKLQDQAVVLDKIGWIYRLMYDHPRSESFYTKSLKIREQVYGQDHSLYAESLLGLGLAYQNQQRREDAVRILEWALALADKHLGPAHPDVNRYLVALGSAREDLFQYGQAVTLYQRSVTLLLRQYGAQSNEVADARWRVALAARNNGNAPLATQMFDASLNQYQRLLGPGPALANRLHDAASGFEADEQLGRAETLLKRALTMRIERMGFEQPEVINNFEALANLYLKMGRFDESLEYRSYASKARNGIDPYE